MKKLFVLLSISFVFFMCSQPKSSDTTATDSNTPAAQPEAIADVPGLIKEVTLNNPLNADMIAKGEGIYDMKCSACHKLTDQRVVGPGWKGLTSKRKPEWIMNMITNVDIMLDKDPEAQKLLAECLTRMPNQNVTQDDARNILEFMFKNDQAQ